MTEFVDQCRAEWTRLGVDPDVAEEMAAQLGMDIEEARADGMSVRDLLGASALNARAFAAQWATERGVARDIEQPAGDLKGPRGRFALAAFAAVAAVCAVAAALLLISGEPKVALATSGAATHLAGLARSTPRPGHHVQASAATPIEWVLLVLALVALAFSAWLWSRPRDPRRAVAAA